MAQSTTYMFEERESYELYNRLQSPWNVIVIDIRSYEAWKEQHIVNSINIPYNINLSNDQLIELLKIHQNKKNKIAMGMLYYIISDCNKNYTKYISLLQNLTHENINKKIPFYHLNISFEEWYKQYPIFCIPDMLKDANSILKLNYKSIDTSNTSTEQKEDDTDDEFNKLLTIIQEKTLIYRRYPACILENTLYLGNVNHARMVETIIGLNIGYIVNVTEHEKCYFEHDTDHNVKYFRIAIDDQEQVNIKQYFENVFKFIDNGIESDKAVLVHCSAGISRSATIVIAWLMKTKHMTFDDAKDYTKDKREVVCPNKGFEKQLKLFEAELFPELNNQINDDTESNGNRKQCVIL